MAARSIALGLLVGGAAIVLLDAEALTVVVLSLGAATVWMIWWLAADGRKHVEGLATGSLDALPIPKRAEPIARTAARVAIAAPIGLGVASAATVLGGFVFDASLVAGCISGSLFGLAGVRAIEAATLGRLERQVNGTVLHAPGPGSRHRHTFFLQPDKTAK